MLDIDGSYGEGGGQLLRLAVTLAAVTGTPIRVASIRARRDKPGLAPQHLAGVRAVGALCGAKIGGLALRSREITFEPRELRGGDYRFDVGTAGSVALVLQALLPVMIAAHAHCRVNVTGGTDVPQAPPADYLNEVLVRLISRLGADVAMRILRRGYYPRGGGEVEVAVRPSRLATAEFDAASRMKAIRGLAHVANLPGEVAGRMRQAALDGLDAYGAQASIETRVLGQDDAYGAGGAIVCWAESEHTVLGAARVAERGVRAEALGGAVGAELAADLSAGAALDVHAADQMPVYFALAGGGAFTTRSVSAHARTAMWLIGRFLPVVFEESGSAGLVHVQVIRARGAA